MSHDQLTPVPRRIGRYEILLPIASGGMGAVYLAKKRALGGFERLVALKVMHAHLREEKEFARDLIEEARIAGLLQHPNVVPVLDVGDDPFGVFLVMEYVEGDSLAGLLRKADRSIPAPIGLRILHDALLGLHAAHELCDEAGQSLDLVHRDFSPQNILIGLDGVSRLTDFGVAKASTRLSLTRTGLVKGKVQYMSPEQAKSEPLDRRSDVWAAGVIAWEILAGRRLYREGGEMAVLLQLVTELPPRLRRVKPDLPQALEDVVSGALCNRVDDRWQTAKRLADALRDAADAIGGLASRDQVAEYLAHTAAEPLARRRQQLRDVIKLRGELETIEREAEHDTRTHSGTPSNTTITERIAPDEAVTGTPQAIDVAARRAVRSRAYVVGALALGAAAAFVYRSATSTPNAALATLLPEVSIAIPSSAPPLQPLAIDLTADAEVRELWVGKRRVMVAPPSRAFQLELVEGEREATLEVVSADGRRARATIEPGAERVNVVFPARARARVQPRRSAPLASSPYDP